MWIDSQRLSDYNEKTVDWHKKLGANGPVFKNKPRTLILLALRASQVSLDLDKTLFLTDFHEASRNIANNSNLIQQLVPNIVSFLASSELRF